MVLLKIEGLCKNFGGLRAIQNVDLEVHEGEIVGLIGPNGSGKTTMMNLVTGFLKPSAGKVTFAGKDITGLPRPNVCRAGIARTFQLIKPFLEFTALQNVMVGRLYGSAPAPNMKVAAVEAQAILEQVGLGAKAQVCAKDLRLMERKRLELGRALATRPKLLLLDELMAGLNHAEAEDAMNLVRKLRASGITILIVEHIVKAIVGLSDRIVVLNMGEKIAEGLPQDIIHNPCVVDVYLGKDHAQC